MKNIFALFLAMFVTQVSFADLELQKANLSQDCKLGKIFMKGSQLVLEWNSEINNSASFVRKACMVSVPISGAGASFEIKGAMLEAEKISETVSAQWNIEMWNQGSSTKPVKWQAEFTGAKVDAPVSDFHLEIPCGASGIFRINTSLFLKTKSQIRLRQIVFDVKKNNCT